MLDGTDAACPSRRGRMPQSLLVQVSLVMVAGVLLAQLFGNLIWAAQLSRESESETAVASQHLARSAVSAARFFMALPANYRQLMIEQFREMGGTRFFVAVNRKPVTLTQIEPQLLSRLAINHVAAVIQRDLPQVAQYHIDLVWPEQLMVSDSGLMVRELPESWVQNSLSVGPKPAPVLVIQLQLGGDNWLYLASLMPNPYFLESGNPLSRDRLLLQGLSLMAVLLISILGVGLLTRPLAALADAASAFGKGETVPPLPKTGSREFVETARAFDVMRERIRCYLDDRERLFVSISHDLRTPITRLRLRAELLDDDELCAEFQEELDELDMMVKGALQCVRDKDIYENASEVKLDPLLERMIRGAQLAGHDVHFTPSGLAVQARPLALKRAIGNLLDNALYYGHGAEITTRSQAGKVEIEIRDHGPGVPAESLPTLFDPGVRLEHGWQKNSNGMGLGLSIARTIVRAHGGELLLANHPDGGFCATIELPH
jgi:signal transduction histidine kinase